MTRSFPSNVLSFQKCRQHVCLVLAFETARLPYRADSPQWELVFSFV